LAYATLSTRENFGHGTGNSQGGNGTSRSTVGSSSGAVTARV
jgi:hypothetical protein